MDLFSAIAVALLMLTLSRVQVGVAEPIPLNLISDTSVDLVWKGKIHPAQYSPSPCSQRKTLHARSGRHYALELFVNNIPPSATSVGIFISPGTCNGAILPSNELLRPRKVLRGGEDGPLKLELLQVNDTLSNHTLCVVVVDNGEPRRIACWCLNFRKKLVQVTPAPTPDVTPTDSEQGEGIDTPPGGGLNVGHLAYDDSAGATQNASILCVLVACFLSVVFMVGV
ncbi:uncharacterized protein LOC135804813 [Sycon ciliatum]|uniref:uncharacterized protein LOC135804813 n=1 Tax=Sycon ciliatum TaxID=27933 RepID=UPI0031F6A8F2